MLRSEIFFQHGTIQTHGVPDGTSLNGGACLAPGARRTGVKGRCAVNGGRCVTNGGVCCRLGLVRPCASVFALSNLLAYLLKKIADFLVLFVVFLMRIKKQERTPVFYLFNAGAA